MSAGERIIRGKGLPACFVIMLGAVLSEVRCAPAGQTRRERWEELLARGKYKELCEECRRHTTSDPQARYMVAEAYRRTGRYKEALALLRGESEREKLLAARILLQTGRLGEALTALKAVRPSAASLYLKGRAYAHQGHTSQAQRAWEDAVELYQAMAYQEAQKAPAAIFAFFGRALMGLDRFEEANEVMLAQGLQKNPEDLHVLLFGGDLFTAKYDFPEGRKYYRKAQRVSRRNPDVLASLAAALLNDPTLGGNRLNEAGALAERALAVNPRHERANVVAGDIALFDGKYQEAQYHYRKAFSTNPCSLEALGCLCACAVLLYRESDCRNAEAQAARISRKPAPFYLAAAKRCELQNLYPRVLSLCEKAYESDPAYWPLYTQLALSELRAGRYDKAEAFVQEGFKRDPYNVWLANTKKLLRHWEKRYCVESWETLVFHVPRSQSRYYVNYLGPLLVRGLGELQKRYGVKPPGRIHVELYPQQEYFACRVLGLPDFPAQGVCFGPVIAVTVPPAYPGNYAVAAWHEFAHVFTVMGSEYRIPRWLTEGISVREESLCPVGGARPAASALGRAVASGDIPGPADFDRRFRRPKNPGEILTAYALAPLAVDFLTARYGEKTLARLIQAVRTKRFPQAFRELTGSDLAQFDRQFKEELRARGKALAEQFAGSGCDVQALRSAVRAGTATARQMADLAWALLNRDKTIDAEQLALALAEKEAFGGDALAVRGLVAMREGSFSKAEKLLRSALKEKSRNAVRILQALSTIARRRKDVRKERLALYKLWRRAPELAAEGGDAGPLGRLCRLLADDPDSTFGEALRDLVRRNRDAVWARFKLAELYRSEGNENEEFQLLKQLVYVAPFTGRGELNRDLFERLAQVAEKLNWSVEAARARKLLAEAGAQ